MTYEKRARQAVAKLLGAIDRAAKALTEAQQAERELAALNDCPAKKTRHKRERGTDAR
jgi:hypothetical protein